MDFNVATYPMRVHGQRQKDQVSLLTGLPLWRSKSAASMLPSNVRRQLLRSGSISYPWPPAITRIEPVLDRSNTSSRPPTPRSKFPIQQVKVVGTPVSSR
jgi:hypothetical protein